MSTITREFTKEQLQQIEAAAKEVMWPVVWSEKKAREHFSEKITPKVVLKLARIALASLEAEAMAHVLSSRAGNDTSAIDKALPEGTMLYTAPPAPVSVPEPIKRNDSDGWWMYKGRRVGCGCAEWYNRALEDCRAAMPHGAEPVTTAYKLPDNTPCKDAPEHIWLQTAGVWPENGEFSELTWCSDNQHPDDTLYVRADVVSGNSPVIPDEVFSAVRKVARIRADFDDFDGDRRGIGDCLDEAEQELIVTINKHASVIAAAPQQEVK